jgi:hypothetical protein
MKSATPSRLRGRVQRLLHSSRLVFRAGRQRLPAFLLAIGCLEVSVGSAAGQPQAPIQLPQARARLEKFRPEALDQQFEKRVFRQRGTAVAERVWQEAILAFQIETLDRVCQLSSAQKKKLELTGRGDIKRLFERCDSLKDKFEALNRRYTFELTEEINAFISAVQAGLFHGRSLLHKSLPNTLTSVQFERYDTIVCEGQRSRHRTAITRLIALLSSGGSPLSDANRERFSSVLSNEIKTTRIAGTLDSYYFDLQLSRIAEEKLKPLLDDYQWQELSRIRREGRAYELVLQQGGYFPNDDDEAEKRDGPPAPVKK